MFECPFAVDVTCLSEKRFGDFLYLSILGLVSVKMKIKLEAKS